MNSKFITSCHAFKGHILIGTISYKDINITSNLIELP